MPAVAHGATVGRISVLSAVARRAKAESVIRHLAVRRRITVFDLILLSQFGPETVESDT
jgi:hypothetical protein